MAGLVIKGLLLVLSVLFLRFAAEKAIMLGANRHVFNHTPGPCRIVPGIDVGSEDITVISTGIAFITSGIKYTDTEWQTLGRSRIFSFDFNHPDKNVSEVDIQGKSFDKEKSNFLGMSIWEDGRTGAVTLFVTNRALQQSSVEVFEYKQDINTLSHKQTITSDAIYSPNDIVAVSDRTFYVTNDLRWDFLELYLPITTGTVAYYDGQRAVLVASGFRMANGINTSPDGRRVYVASAFDGELHIYNRNKDDSLTLIQKIDLHTTIDNIEIDKATGDLWIGCHPQPYKLLFGDPNDRNKGLSQVLRVKLDQDLRLDVREVLADDGQLGLRGSSVACKYGQSMLVGTIKNKMLYCQLLAF